MVFIAWNHKRYWKNDFIGKKILLKIYSIKYASEPWTVVICFFKLTILKCENRIFYKVFSHFSECKIFVKIVLSCFYLLIMHYHDKNFQKTKLHNLGPSLPQIAKFFPKRNFLVSLNVNCIYQYCPILLLNNSEISMSNKEIFWEKWLLPLPTYCVLSYHLTF